MATFLFPSSFRCDCGHESHFFVRPLRELEQLSRRKPQVLINSEQPEHRIHFERGKAVAVTCPKLGRQDITGTE